MRELYGRYFVLVAAVDCALAISLWAIAPTGPLIAPISGLTTLHVLILINAVMLVAVFLCHATCSSQGAKCDRPVSIQNMPASKRRITRIELILLVGLGIAAVFISKYATPICERLAVPEAVPILYVVGATAYAVFMRVVLSSPFGRRALSRDLREVNETEKGNTSRHSEVVARLALCRMICGLTAVLLLIIYKDSIITGRLVDFIAYITVVAGLNVFFHGAAMIERRVERRRAQ